MNQLFKKMNEIDISDFFLVEGDFFQYLYEVRPQQKTSAIIAFLNISNWLGYSLRDGVWTYYEMTDPMELQVTLDYVKQSDAAMARYFEMGIHDYQNPKYNENYDYPEDWLVESEKIDDWLFQHEKYIWQWEKELLLSHEKEITDAIGDCF